MTDKVQKIREEVERLKLCTMDEHMKFYSEAAEAEYNALCKVEKIIDSLQEEPVSKELEEASRNYADNEEYGDDVYFAIEAAFKAGANWQKEHLWKPSEEMLEALYRVIPENVMAISEDEMLLDKLYQGLKYGKVLSKK